MSYCWNVYFCAGGSIVKDETAKAEFINTKNSSDTPKTPLYRSPYM